MASTGGLFGSEIETEEILIYGPEQPGAAPAPRTAKIPKTPKVEVSVNADGDLEIREVPSYGAKALKVAGIITGVGAAVWLATKILGGR